MATTLTQGDGRAANPGGVYRQKETGQELVAVETAKFGSPQADAFVRLGYEYVGPAPRQLQVADPTAPRLTSPAGTKSAAELRVELQEAESREADFAETRKENEGESLVDAKETDVKASDETFTTSTETHVLQTNPETPIEPGKSKAASKSTDAKGAK